MLEEKKILFVSPTVSSFTHPVTQALKRLGAEVYNFYDNMPSFSSRVLGFLANRGIRGTGIVKRHFRTNVNSVLENQLRDLKPHYLLVIKGIGLDATVIKRAKESGVVTINWFPDCQDVWEWLKKNASVYQYFFTCCLDLLSPLKDIGVNCYYLPYAADSDKKLITLPKRYNLVFVGQYTRRREDYFSQVAKMGLDIWGYARWKKSLLANHYRGQLSAVAIKDTFHQSKIVLNMTTSESENGFIAANLRNFEVTGAQSFLLTQTNEAIQQLFQDGKEIICFTDKADLLAKASYYLEHDRERESIARAGWVRVTKDHSYEQRLREMFQLLEKS